MGYDFSVAIILHNWDATFPSARNEPRELWEKVDFFYFWYTMCDRTSELSGLYRQAKMSSDRRIGFWMPRKVKKAWLSDYDILIYIRSSGFAGLSRPACFPRAVLKLTSRIPTACVQCAAPPPGPLLRKCEEDRQIVIRLTHQPLRIIIHPIICRQFH